MAAPRRPRCLMPATDKFYIAGHKGLVGSAVLRALLSEGYNNIVVRTSEELDLTDQAAVRRFFESERPDRVVLAAARVGGILANNTYRAEFIYSNLAIQTNVIDAAYRSGVKRLLFLGSSCIYPRLCPQPMKEKHLLSGPLEPTNEPYALAKIAGIKMCDAYNHQYGTDFMSLMSTNSYGVNDHFELETSHVLPALMRKIHEAKTLRTPSVPVWGTGKAKREFIHADDLARACLMLLGMNGYRRMVNVGSGAEISIRRLAETICEVVGYEGKLEFDHSKPDGTPRKLLDISRIKSLGWRPTIGLREGLASTYEWFLQHKANRHRPRASVADTEPMLKPRSSRRSRG